jgi:ankyrin repeat protein
MIVPVQRRAEGITTTTGDTPLHKAAGWECEGDVRVLLNSRAHVNAKNDDGKTPLERLISY